MAEITFIKKNISLKSWRFCFCSEEHLLLDGISLASVIKINVTVETV